MKLDYMFIKSNTNQTYEPMSPKLDARGQFWYQFRSGIDIHINISKKPMF